MRNKENQRKWAKEHRLKNPGKNAAYIRKYRKMYPNRYHGYDLKKRYGIGIEEKNVMVRCQNNRCLICDKEFDSIATAKVDHNHTTKKIRGLLCTNCNCGIGQFKDNPYILMKAVLYLQKNG